MQLTKKAFTWSVVLLTIVWSMGLAALVAPAAAQAATCPEIEAGDLIKGSTAAVYYVDANMNRHYFLNAEVYKTWYPDYSGIQTVDNSCMGAYKLVGAVPFRPGSRMVKTVDSAAVYAVTSGAILVQIDSEAAATALYGAGWAKLVRDVDNLYLPAAFTQSDDMLDGSMPHDGQLVKVSGGTTVYAVMNGMFVEVEGTLGVLSADVRTISASMFDEDLVSDETVAPATLLTISEKAAAPGDDEPGDDEPVAAGSVMVSLAASTPAGTTLSNSTAYNPVLSVTLKAGSDKSAAVKGLTVKKTGLIANERISGVSVWHNGYRLGDVMSSFNSNNEVTLGFGGESVVIPAGGTETLTVAFNFDSSATGGTVGASIPSASAIDTTAEVTGSFPIAGNSFGLTDGSASLSAVKVEGQAVGGLSSEPSSATAGNVEIGETKDISKIKFTETTGRNDVTLNQVTLYFQGTMKDKDLNNLQLVAPDNSVLATVSEVSNRYATFVLATPYTIPEGSNRVLTVRAKIADGSGNWFRVQVQSDYDVLVKDASVGYFMVPTDSDGGTWSAVSSSSGYFKMKSGTLTVTKKTTSPSTNVAAGATDVVLARYDLKAVGEALEVRKIGLQVVTSTVGSAQALTGNVRVVVDGTTHLTVSAGTTLYSSASTQYNLSQYINLSSGQSKVLEVIGSIPTSATSASTYQVKVGNMYAKRLATLDFADNLPSSSLVAANQLSVNSTVLTFTKDTSMGNSTVASGGTQVLGKFIARAGESEKICLTNASVAFNDNGGFDITKLQNLEIFVGDSAVGTTLGTVASSSNSFSFNECIDPNQQKTLSVKATVVSGAAGAASSSVTLTYVGQTTSNSDSSTAVGQDMTFGSANVILAAANDSSTISAIRTPSSAPVQLGKWSLQAQNDKVTLNKITFQVRDDSYADDTSAGNFGTLTLYKSTDMSTPVGTANYVPGTSNGYVQFTGLNMSVNADETVYLVLKGVINGSNAMNAASINVFVVKSDSSSDMEITAAAGGTLGTSQIDATAGDNTTNSRFATSTYYLFHNSAPTLALASGVDTTIDLQSEEPIFKYTITNSGDREMKITTTTVGVTVSGLTTNGTATGTITTFKLYEANESGGLGTLLASNTGDCFAGGAGLTAPDAATACTTGATASVEFGPLNDANSLFDNFLIPANASRTFIVVADTQGALNAKTSGSVTLSAKLDGATGFNASADTYEDNWADGVIEYYYTPVGGTINSDAYTASDSYDVNGPTLKYQF